MSVQADFSDGDLVDIYIVSVTDDVDIIINNFFLVAEIAQPPASVSLTLALYSPEGYLWSYDDNPSDGLVVWVDAPDISSGFGGDYSLEVTASGSASCSDYVLRTYNGS